MVRKDLFAAMASSSGCAVLVLIGVLWVELVIAAECQRNIVQDLPPREPLRRTQITLKNRAGRPVTAYLSINPAAFTVKRRSKRSSSGNLCSLRHLSADKNDFLFQSFNGQRLEVLEPDTLRLNYCSGSCPVGVRSPDITYNVIFLDMVRVLPNFSHVPSPCCVPSKFRRSSIIVKRDSGYIEHLTLDNMTVRQCECR
ncbi:hypothetical protein CAPTEDRAFT_193460 [Capitella teleta]|uniref:TGF-beta family profile domain-containing protein n=1 Tax=Capitella teleta TaxID=283909 RepID=R7U2U4_CAPTE|nr:hypothetical protein CAPTEDRAFT_193460 [Capitella teleta]|eukprot:ELT97500.1 hypothetical protein CAPTEDRAFT_193460 [Capitella teleta]